MKEDKLYTEKDLVDFVNMVTKTNLFEFITTVMPKTYVEENKKYDNEKEHGYDLCIKQMIYNVKKYYGIDLTNIN